MQNKKFTSSKIEELKKKKKKIFKIKIIIFSVLLVLIFIGFSFLSKWQRININNISVEGNKVLNESDLKNAIQEEINGKYLWLFPKTNSFLIPKSKIKRVLYEKFGRIETLNLNINNFQNINLTITERIPIYTWCGEVLPDINIKKQEENCSFVDKNGFVFDHAPYFSGDVYIRFYGSLEKDILNLKDFEDTKILIEKIKELNLNPVSLFYKDNNETEIFLSSNKHIKEAPKIIFNSNEDKNLIFENLDVGVSSEPLKSDLKNNYSNLLYIDLRFNNKVFYKFN